MIIAKLINKLAVTAQTDSILKVFTVKSKVNTVICVIDNPPAFAHRRLS